MGIVLCVVDGNLHPHSISLVISCDNGKESYACDHDCLLRHIDQEIHIAEGKIQREKKTETQKVICTHKEIEILIHADLDTYRGIER